MKNNQQGFMAIVLIVLIALTAIGGGTYIYSQKQEVGSENQSQLDNKVEPGILPTPIDKSKVEIKDEVKQSPVSIKSVNTGKVYLDKVEKPDLTIEDITIYDTLATSQKTVGYQQLTAKVCNRGKVGINTGNLTKTPEKISISFTLNGITVYSNKSIPSILPGNCDPLVGFYNVELNTSYGPFKGIKSGNYSVTAKADAESKVDESNEDNNSFTKNVYLNFEQTIKKLSVISPTASTAWKEEGEYTISWQPFSSEVARYYVTIGNYSAGTSLGLPSTYSQQGIGTKTSLIFKVEDGFVNGMFAGDNKGKTILDIKNDFYIEVTATNSNGDQIGSGRSDTFTIEP